MEWDEERRRITEAFKAELEKERLRIEEANRLLDEEWLKYEFEKAKLEEELIKQSWKSEQTSILFKDDEYF